MIRTAMRFAFAALCLLSSAFAQAPLPDLKIDAITGGSVLFVRNSSQQPLVAYMIELVDYPGSSFSLSQDALLSGEPIAPGVEKRIQITNMTVGAVPDYVKLSAAIYADGSTAGVPEKIVLLTGRRKAQLEVARDMIKRLEASEDLSPWIESLKPEGKPKYDSPTWVNRAAQHSFALHFKQKLAVEPPTSVLAQLRTAERQLAAALLLRTGQPE